MCASPNVARLIAATAEQLRPVLSPEDRRAVHRSHIIALASLMAEIAFVAVEAQVGMSAEDAECAMQNMLFIVTQASPTVVVHHGFGAPVLSHDESVGLAHDGFVRRLAALRSTSGMGGTA